jgi:hypothetical protein
MHRKLFRKMRAYLPFRMRHKLFRKMNLQQLCCFSKRLNLKVP